MTQSRLEILKQSSAGHSLIKAARLYNETMIQLFRETFDLPSLQLYHLNLFAHIDLNGSTVVQISSRAGISKQAVSKAVNELVAMGLLLESPHPKDARSKLISFPTSGRYTLENGVQFLKKQDKVLEDIIGAARMEDFRNCLALIVDKLDADH